MPHPFFKYASAGLPSRVDASLWTKIKKCAHDVWQVDGTDGIPSIQRIKGETVTADISQEPDINMDPGQLVLLFLGGRRIEAKIISTDESNVSISVDGESISVPKSWIKSI